MRDENFDIVLFYFFLGNFHIQCDKAYIHAQFYWFHRCIFCSSRNSTAQRVEVCCRPKLSNTIPSHATTKSYTWCNVNALCNEWILQHHVHKTTYWNIWRCIQDIWFSFDFEWYAMISKKQLICRIHAGIASYCLYAMYQLSTMSWKRQEFKSKPQNYRDY